MSELIKIFLLFIALKFVAKSSLFNKSFNLVAIKLFDNIIDFSSLICKIILNIFKIKIMFLKSFLL